MLNGGPTVFYSQITAGCTIFTLPPLLKIHEIQNALYFPMQLQQDYKTFTSSHQLLQKINITVWNIKINVEKTHLICFSGKIEQPQEHITPDITIVPRRYRNPMGTKMKTSFTSRRDTTKNNAIGVYNIKLYSIFGKIISFFY